VKSFVALAEGLERLDAVIANAGVMPSSFVLAEGTENTIKVNVLSTLLLALMIVPKLRDTAKTFCAYTHLEIVTSEAHHITTVSEADQDDLYAALSEERKRFDAREQ
jgi:retinol dehydrogenase-12